MTSLESFYNIHFWTKNVQDIHVQRKIDNKAGQLISLCRRQRDYIGIVLCDLRMGILSKLTDTASSGLTIGTVMAKTMSLATFTALDASLQASKVASEFAFTYVEEVWKSLENRNYFVTLPSVCAGCWGGSGEEWQCGRQGHQHRLCCLDYICSVRSCMNWKLHHQHHLLLFMFIHVIAQYSIDK